MNTENYIVISWNKYANSKPKNIVTFATLCKKDNIISFCNLTNGTIYKINFKALIGAFWKDGATLIENKSRINKYTIGVIGNKAINSYNGATKLITPKQLVQIRENDYKSKNNELILDGRYIEEIGPYEIEKNVSKLK